MARAHATCTICCADVSQLAANTITLACGHTFHWDAAVDCDGLAQWYGRQNTCPTCRGAITARTEGPRGANTWCWHRIEAHTMDGVIRQASAYQSFSSPRACSTGLARESEDESESESGDEQTLQAAHESELAVQQVIGRPTRLANNSVGDRLLVCDRLLVGAGGRETLSRRQIPTSNFLSLLGSLRTVRGPGIWARPDMRPDVQPDMRPDMQPAVRPAVRPARASAPAELTIDIERVSEWAPILDPELD